ncbi:MAG: hypothetical protein H6Q89_5222, partial [Myxococcaceae bacterium]|nr:hypothetical protein [Myxococcaceae bacterium]
WVAPPPVIGAFKPVTGYTVTSSPGGFTATTTGATTAAVNGLANGTSYTFTVTATNVIGTGPASVPSNAVVPFVSAPAAPTSVAAGPGNASATVSWVAPFDGNSPITGYTVTSSPGGLSATTTGATTAAVAGLTNNTSYTFTVTATNAIGTGPASAPSSPVVPFTGPPLAPTGVAAIAGNAQATVNWTPPLYDGSSPITGYTVTSSPLGVTASTTGATSAIVTGLTNGTTFTFTVTASNTFGTGPSSTASCPPPNAMCSGVCVNLQTNFNHCGSCFISCGGFFGGCQNGQCEP